MTIQKESSTIPKYLFKILSWDHWQNSQMLSSLILSDQDKSYIHFSTEEQIEGIAQKYWSTVSEYVILTVDVSKLIGKLILERNPGKINYYYYHLYEGSIPLEAVTSVKLVSNKKN